MLQITVSASTIERTRPVSLNRILVNSTTTAYSEGAISSQNIASLNILNILW